MARVTEFLDKINRVKREIISKTLKLYEIRKEYIRFIEKTLARKQFVG